ncbi:MAG: hypothetical protein ACI85F_002538 [Bacteroidia bacterium]|jgi:hypothetical protein
MIFPTRVTLLFLTLMPFFGLGQDVLEFVRDNPRLTVEHESDRLDSLLAKRARVDLANPTMKGYRVQVFSGSGNEARQKANQLRSEFLQLYPNIATHLVFQQPNFKVRIGDLRTELEAIRLKKEIGYDYPNGFVVRDMIDLPPLPEQDEEREEELEPELKEGSDQ